MGVAYAWAWNQLSSTELNGMTGWVATSTTSVVTLASTFAGPLGVSLTQYMLRTISSNSNIQRTLPAAIDKGWLHFRVKSHPGYGLWHSSYVLAGMYDGATVRVYITTSAASVAAATLRLYVNGTLVGTTTTQVSDTERCIGIKFDVSIATAAAAIWVDGTQEVGTGGNLVAGSGGTQTVDTVRLGGGIIGGHTCYFSDFIVFDALADPGDKTSLYCPVFRPTDDVLTTGWTSTGANFFGELDDEAAATYAQSTTDPTGDLEIGLQERADLDALFTAGSFEAVVVHAWAAGDGALQAATLGLKSNAAAQSTARTLGAVGDTVCHVSLVDPDTAAAWTGAAVDALTTTMNVT